MDADSKGLVAELDKVNQRYGSTTAEINKQQAKLMELQAQEEKLAIARAKANNPTTAIKYQQKLDETKKSIQDLTLEINKMSRSQQEVGKNTENLGRKLDKAFDVAQVAAMRTEVAAMGKQFEGTGRKIDEPIKKTISLKAQLRALKEQLANTDDDETFLKLSIEAGKLEDKLGDARAAAQIFADDNPMLAFGKSIRGVAADLLSLNFADAAQKSQLLVKAGQQMTFASSVKGMKDLGVTLANVGRALLTNPIFLIGAAVALIVTNFGKLKNAGGLIGTVFIAIGRAIDVVIRAGKDLLDFLGLIDATKKSLEELIGFNDDLIKSYENYYKQRISILNSSNQRVIELENQQTQKILAVTKKQNEQIFKDLQEKGSATEDYYEAIKKMQENGMKASDVFTANQVRNNELEIKGQDKLRALRLQIADERDKGKEQNLNLGLQKDTPELIEKIFKLEVAGLARLQKEEKRVAEIELKDTDAVGAAKALINAKFAQQRLNLKRKEVADIIAAEKRIALLTIDTGRERQLSELNSFANKKLLVGEEGVEQAQIQAEAELEILIQSNNAKQATLEKYIKIKKAANLEVITDEKELKDFVIKSDEEVSASALKLTELKKSLDLAEIASRTSHEQALFDITTINQTKIREILSHQASFKTQLEIDAAKETLERLKKDNLATIQEIKDQENKIIELKAKKLEEEKEQRKQLILAILDGIQSVTDATFTAINQQLDAQIAFKDKQLGIQQERIDEAKNLADKGNAELLQLEKKRLDDLNKEKEKYVRRQQSLIALELVANSSLAVAKAAAQGGIAAPFTIAATLIALIAGLAQAKSVAAQAAFYEGGEYNGQGYTGDGNPRGESNKVGRKPYTYHNQEFIFNHKTTSKYKDIFHDIHKGNIDLNEWRSKVDAFESIKNNPMAMMVNNNGDIMILNKKMDDVVSAIRAQEMHMNMDGKGFSVYLKNITSRNDFIKNTLAKN